MVGASSVSGTLAAVGDVIALAVEGMGAFGVQLSGTWTGTIVFEGAIADGNYVALNMTPPTGGSAVTSSAAAGVWVGSAAGLKLARLRCTAIASGLVVVDLHAAAVSAGSGASGGGSSPSGTIGAAVPSTASPVAVKDNLGNLTYPLVDASGNLLVAVTGAGSGGTSSVDGAGWTAGVTAGTPLIGARDDTAPGTVAEDKLGVARITTNRALHSNLRKADGTEIGVGGAAVIVDGSAVTQPVSGTLTAVTAITNALPAGSNVIGHVIADSGSTTAVTALPAITGTVTANAGTNLNTSALALEAGGNLATLAGTVSSGRAAVNPISGQAGVQGASGVVTATTQRVVLATDVVPTVAGNKSSDTAAPGATNLGVLPAVATAFTPGYTEGNQVPLSTNLSGGLRITGAISATVTGVKTNNAVPPDSLNVGALVAVATAAAPTYTEGNEVLLSTDLTGGVRTSAPAQGATGSGVVGPMVQALVSDSRESYVDATVRPFSLTSDGRLRVSATPGDVYLEFFNVAGSPFFDLPSLTAADDLWSLGPNGLSWA